MLRGSNEAIVGWRGLYRGVIGVFVEKASNVNVWAEGELSEGGVNVQVSSERV